MSASLLARARTKLLASRPRVRPEFSFTREGKVFVVVTLGVGIGAVNTGNNLLYLVLGLLLGLLLTSGVLSEIVLRGVRIERAPAPRLFAGAPALFELRATNDKRRLASTSFEVGDVAEGDAGPITSYVPRLEPGATAYVVVTRVPARRGVLRGTHVRIRTRFPFGILEKTRTIQSEHEWLVYPRIVPVERERGTSARSGDEASRPQAGMGAEVLGLRGHRDGDGVRDLHARRTAALGRPVSKERAAELDEPVDIVLRRRAVLPVARFEEEVSRAASLAMHAVELGRPFVLRDEASLLAEGRDRASLEHALAKLALVRQAGGPS